MYRASIVDEGEKKTNERTNKQTNYILILR